MMKQEPWTNRITQIAFRSLLEDMDDLDAYVNHQQDSLHLAIQIHDAFERTFLRHPCPFTRHIGLRSLMFVNFREIAERLLRMIHRQRAHLER